MFRFRRVRYLLCLALLCTALGGLLGGHVVLAAQENTKLSADVLAAIIEAAEGSARKALVILNQIIGMDEDDRMATITARTESKQAIELARALLNGSKWPTVSKLLKEIDEDPESLRYMILGYMQAVLLGGGKMAGRAFDIIDTFRDNFYDSKKAGLVAACWEVCK